MIWDSQRTKHSNITGSGAVLEAWRHGRLAGCNGFRLEIRTLVVDDFTLTYPNRLLASSFEESRRVTNKIRFIKFLKSPYLEY
jgi:hypothetical protein